MLTYSDESVDEALFARKAHKLRPLVPFVRTAVGVVLLAALVVGILLARGWRPNSKDSAARPGAASEAGMPTSAAIESKYGIRFLGVDVTSGGGMIQVRYQVLDSDKGEAIHDADVAPVIVDGSGKTYADPGMVGHSHVGKTQAPGTSDYILLANARGGVKPGSMVTIKVGDLELRNVPVA
jgi:hypothetical protein